MRGKTLIWLSVIAMLLGAMAPAIIAVDPDLPKPHVWVDPALIVNQDLSTEYFTASVKVSNASGLYVFGIILEHVGYASVLGAVEVTSPDFTIVSADIDVLHGEIAVVGRYDSVGEFSGEGTLFEVLFRVFDAGDSPLELTYISLIHGLSGKTFSVTWENGFYDGPNAHLIRSRLAKRPMQAGETQEWGIKVRNDGLVPLKVKARIDMTRLEDGEIFTIWAGQSFTTAPPRPSEYLYVDGFDYSREYWTAVGAAPYLDVAGDGNYIEGTFDTAQHRWFSFEDVDLSDGAAIKTITLEGYTNGPYEEGTDYDIYGLSTGGFNWLGSLYATGDWAWVKPRWVGGAPASDIDPALRTEAGLNSLVVLAYFYDPDGLSVGGDIIDCLRLKVEFWPPISPVDPPVYTLQPGETLELDPTTWMLRSDDVGTYVTTTTLLFTANDWAWVPFPKVKTRTWWVTP